MYTRSGTHMHAPEYRQGADHPIVMIRSLCIVLYVHSCLYSTIYSIRADISMQEESKGTQEKEKAKPTQTYEIFI